MVTQTMIVLLLVGVLAMIELLSAKSTPQPTTEPTGVTCQVLQGPPGPPGTCSYTEMSLVKGVRDISTSLKESIYNLTTELTNSNNDLRISLQEIKQVVAQMKTEEPPCPRSLGLSSYKPAKSCREILQCNPSAPSSYYWLKSTTMECREVYCAMDTTYCNITGGWMRLGYFNMTEPGASCPSSLRQINTPAKLCGRRTAPGCSGVTFPTDGIRYSKVCGQARGYQYYSVDAFGHKINNINSYYVDGVAITYGSPRHHLWTYAAGLSDDYNYRADNCPCAKYPGRDPPDFVGLDYYCESGITGQHYGPQLSLEDPLWDGDECSEGNSCCDQPGLPWFYRTLPQEVGDNIEVRLCANEGTANEEIYVDLVEIYVQ